MGICKKWIFRNMIPWLITMLVLGLAALSYAVRIPQIDRNLNEIYKQQAIEMGLDKPQVVADSGNTSFIFGAIGAAFLLGACFSLSKLFIPQTSRMGKSLLRYAKYEGESDIKELFNEAEGDLAHGAVFGDITIGENWIVGRSFPPGGQVVRLSYLCAAYHTTEIVYQYGSDGKRTASKWSHLYLFDDKKHQTELLTPKESNLMAAYNTLLRRNPYLLHGGEKEQNIFIDLPDEEQERLLGEVYRKSN